MDPTALQQLGLTEDQIAQLMEMGALAEEGGIIGQEMEMANQLRNTPGPQGRFTGKAYVRANPMEFVGAGLQQAMGGIQQQKGIKQQRENAQAQADLRKQYMEALIGNLRNPQGATITPSQVPNRGLAAPQRTAQQMFPMPGGAGATVTPAMLRR